MGPIPWWVWRPRWRSPRDPGDRIRAVASVALLRHALRSWPGPMQTGSHSFRRGAATGPAGLWDRPEPTPGGARPCDPRSARHPLWPTLEGSELTPILRIAHPVESRFCAGEPTPATDRPVEIASGSWSCFQVVGPGHSATDHRNATAPTQSSSLMDAPLRNLDDSKARWDDRGGADQRSDRVQPWWT
jgi:hypothetical protein